MLCKSTAWGNPAQAYLKLTVICIIFLANFLNDENVHSLLNCMCIFQQVCNELHVRFVSCKVWLKCCRCTHHLSPAGILHFDVIKICWALHWQFLVAVWHSSNPVSTGMGDLTSYPGQLGLLSQQDGNWVLAKVWWCSKAGDKEVNCVIPC